MKALGRIATCFPQTAYTGLVKALQNEWTYLQWVTTGSGNLYAPIEKAITEDFLPALLGQANIGQTIRDQTALAVKRAGLGIPNPTTTTGDNYSASIDCSKLLVESVLTGEPIDIVAYQKHATNSQKSSKEPRKAKELGRLAELKRGVDKATVLQMGRACRTLCEDNEIRKILADVFEFVRGLFACTHHFLD